MVKRLILLLALLPVLAACAADPQVVEVRVPVYTRPAPPPELLEPVAGPGEVFADGPQGLGFVEGGVDRLVVYVGALRARLGAWEVWAE